MTHTTPLKEPDQINDVISQNNPTGGLTFTLTGSSGNSSGLNVGAGYFALDSTHSFSLLTINSISGSCGAKYIHLEGESNGNLSVKSYDVYNKAVQIDLYVYGSKNYSQCQASITLS